MAIIDSVTRVQILDETAYFSLSTNALGKGMNPIAPLSYRQIVGQTALFNFGMVTRLGEGKLSIQICQSKIKLTTVVEGYQKALFSIATTPMGRGGRYPFRWIDPLYPQYVPYIAEC